MYMCNLVKEDWKGQEEGMHDKADREHEIKEIRGQVQGRKGDSSSVMRRKAERSSERTKKLKIFM